MDIARNRKKARLGKKKKKSEEITIGQADDVENEDSISEGESPGEEKEIRDIKQESFRPSETEIKESKTKGAKQKAVKKVDKSLPQGGVTDEEVKKDTLELITFRLLDEEFAFRVSEVEEIVRYQRMTLVPTVPDYVLGITSLRGKVIPVIDLKTRLGIKNYSISKDYNNVEPADQQDTEAKEKILVISGPKGLIGALVDKVIGVVRLPASEVLEPPAHLTEAELRFIEGVVIFEKRFISIIRLEDNMNIEFS